MEKHLMAKKIAEVEKILQTMNNATNKIIIEMNNRIDNLNQNWQKRLQYHNEKWKNDKHTTHSTSVTETRSSRDIQIESSRNVSDAIRQTERRLFEITDRLASVEKMEQKLEEIIKILKRRPYNQSEIITSPIDNLQISESENVDLTRLTRSMPNGSISNIPHFYGVIEMTETYFMVLSISFEKEI
ncbi:hypothetical protein X798_06580, partial [Onchocerca flexuosa]